MPDEGLMRIVEEERDKGRDDYPVRAVWNSVLAGVVYEHQSVQSLRRELKRNGQVRVKYNTNFTLTQHTVLSDSR
jgi:hypothetical protein